MDISGTVECLHTPAVGGALMDRVESVVFYGS